jgi:hypothetical protein
MTVAFISIDKQSCYLATSGVVEGLLALPAAWTCYDPTLEKLEAFAIDAVVDDDAADDE